MDYLDTLHLDSPRKKCNKVRSWYLYEQYKSLEKNQLDAARRLKEKSNQDRLLRQEMNERRIRRSLYDHFEKSHSDCKLERNFNSASQVPSVSDDDLYESFCEFHEEYELDTEDVTSQYSKTSKNGAFISTENKNLESNYIDNTKIDGPDNNIKDELDVVKRNIADNITLQLETVKENIQCLEKFAKFGDDEKNPDDKSSIFNQLHPHIVDDQKLLRKKTKTNSENCILSMWTKFVEFAYKIVQLNHGNSYYDYSSQFLTAVLACDVLRRGVSNICHLLQPYVSPIKYTSDSDVSLVIEKDKNLTRNKDKNKKFNKTINNTKCNRCNRKRHKFRSLGRKYQSEDLWYNSRNTENLSDAEYPGVSESWHNDNRYFGNELSDKSSCKWPDDFRKYKFSEENLPKCRCLKCVVNPMLQLARYIDSIIQDIEQ